MLNWQIICCLTRHHPVMLSSIVFGCLISSPLQNQDPTLPDQIREAFGKVVSAAGDLKAEVPTLGFHNGACLLGGSLKQGGQFSFSIVINNPTDYAALVGAYGNDSEVEVTVKDSAGKNTVTDTDEKGSLFEPKSQGKYTVTAKNKGAETFIALALVRESGGVTHSFSGINTAVAGIAAGVKSSFLDGYSVPSNQLMILGSVIEPGASYGQTTSYNFPRWMVLAGVDAGPKSFQVTVKNPSGNETVAGIEDKTFSYCEFDHPVPNANVVIKNTGSRKILAMQAVLR